MELIEDTAFQRIASLAYERWGLNITEQKRELVTARMSKLLRKTPFDSADAFLDHLTRRDATEEELLEFFDMLSTNVTSFFRERAHFDYLEREFYTPLARGTMTTPGKKLRLWSAACSTGMEPYTMAIHASECLGGLDGWDFKILATDLSNSAIRAAREAEYEQRSLAQMSPELVEKYFEPGSRPGLFRVVPEITERVSIGRLNLHDPWPFSGPFDIVFCRNVMIYFDQPTRQTLVDRIHDIVRPGGVFAVGSAESLSGLDTPFTTAQPSVYTK